MLSALFTSISQKQFTYFAEELAEKRYKLGAMILSSNGVSFPGRYGHGKPAKPVNTALSALHRFQSYIISVCFQGHFYISGSANFCSGVVLPASIYSQAKVAYYHGNSDTIRQNSVLSRKSRYSQAKPIYKHGNCLYYHGNRMGVFVIV